MNHKILVTRSSMPEYGEYCREIRELWDSHWLTNMGIKHQTLQSRLECYLKVPHVTLYTNGHLALEGVLSGLEMRKGGEIITTPFTFASTTHAIVRSGFIPVFCDINENDLTIDADKIEALITEKTVAILPVHVYGHLCDVEKIQEIADRYELKVIYDAAHAFGVQNSGVGVANYGDASMFSFHATKVFNTIEGGCVCYKNDEYKQILDDMKNFGIRGQESCMYVGGNAKMNEFQAAMGICNLRHVDENIEDRKRVAKRYLMHLEGVDGIKVFSDQDGVKSNYAYFPVVFDGYRYTRDEIFAKLNENGILSRKYFYPITNDFECYKDYPTAGKEKTPIAAHYADCVLTLPMYAGLEDGDIDRICKLILE